MKIALSDTIQQIGYQMAAMSDAFQDIQSNSS